MVSFYLILIFFIIATIYSSIGFGGGSSYIAILLLLNIPFEHIPFIALTCNLIVVCGSAIHYIKKSHVNWRFLSPFILTSIPFAYLGGSLTIEKSLLKLILGICLILASFRMVLTKKIEYTDNQAPQLYISTLLGSLLGFLSGLVGIGGGIFLSPILYNLKWGKPNQISAICCLFIFFNSISGLLGQLSKLSFNSVQTEFISPYWPLAISVLLGGQLGVFIGMTKLKPRWIELTTAVLIFVVAMRIIINY